MYTAAAGRDWNLGPRRGIDRGRAYGEGPDGDDVVEENPNEERSEDAVLEMEGDHVGDMVDESFEFGVRAVGGGGKG